MKKKLVLFFIFFIFIEQTYAQEDIMIMKLKDGDVIIELFGEIAPEHVKRFKLLANEKKYDGVVFHRVIVGFMAQTGDVQFGNPNLESFDLRLAGTGGSEYPDLKAEFSDIPHERGTISMARLEPGTASSEFFICINDQPQLDFGGMRNPDGQGFAAFGKVTSGLNVVKKIQMMPVNGQILQKTVKIMSIKRD